MFVYLFIFIFLCRA